MSSPMASIFAGCILAATAAVLVGGATAPAAVIRRHEDPAMRREQAGLVPSRGHTGLTRSDPAAALLESTESFMRAEPQRQIARRSLPDDGLVGSPGDGGEGGEAPPEPGGGTAAVAAGAMATSTQAPSTTNVIASDVSAAPKESIEDKVASDASAASSVSTDHADSDSVTNSATTEDTNTITGTNQAAAPIASSTSSNAAAPTAKPAAASATSSNAAVPAAKPAAVLRFGFILKSVALNQCLSIAKDDQTFELTNCNSNDPHQKFTAYGVLGASEDVIATNVTMHNGKVLCFIGSDKVEAYDESCVPDFAGIELEPTANEKCFKVKWNTNEQITSEKCLAPPQNDQDMMATNSLCSDARLSLWSSDPNETSCD